MPQILEAFDSLAEENDVIVIEAPAAPPKSTLPKTTLSTWGSRAPCPPRAARGATSTQAGCLPSSTARSRSAPEHRALLRGLVVNKFRGDVKILRPGLAPLEKMCGVPVVGSCRILRSAPDDEDSLAPRLSAREARGVIDVAVVRLPHLSNFTDFDPLSRVPGVGVRYVPRRPIWADPTCGASWIEVHARRRALACG